jgi:hypothetical protein
LSKENRGKGEQSPGSGCGRSLAEGPRYLDRAERLTFDPIGITVEKKEYGTEFGAFVRVTKVATQVIPSLASDLMDAADFHRRIVKEQLSLEVIGKLCEKVTNQGWDRQDIPGRLDEQHQALHSGTSASCPGSRAGSTVRSSPC